MNTHLIGIYNATGFIGAMGINESASKQDILAQVQNHIDQYYDGQVWTHIELEGIVEEAAE